MIPPRSAPSFVFEQPASQAEPRTFARGPMTSFAEVAAASIDEAWFVHNSTRSIAALEEAYKRQISRVYEATGAEFSNPIRDIRMRDAYPVLPFGVGQREPEGGWGMDAAVARAGQAFDRQMAELREKNPDKLDKLPRMTVMEEALSITREAAERAADIRGRAEDGFAGFGGSLAGGVAGSFADPVQLATMPVGFGSRTIVGAAMKEAAVNAGIVGALEFDPNKTAWLDQAGVEYGPEQMWANIATAATFGGILGGAGKFGQQATGRLLFDRSAFEVFQAKYNALPPDHPFRQDETLGRAIAEVQSGYDDADLNPGTDPEAHAARLAEARHNAAEPDAFPPPGEAPERVQLRELIDNRASAEEIWASPLAQEIDQVAAGTPTMRAGDPIPEGREYLLPDPSSNEPRRAGLDEAVEYLADQARMRAGPEGPLQESRAIFVVGYPGAGKSTFITRFAEAARAAVADTDDAKVIVPEYAGGRGAQIVNNESSALREEVVQRLVADGDNLIFETLGRNPQAALEVAEALKERGYTVEIAHVRVNPDEAVRRQWASFLDSGRSIAPSFMRSIVGKVEQGWEALIDSGAFSRYLDIDNSGEPGAATAREIRGRDPTGRRGEPELEEDLRGSGQAAQGEAWDLAEAVGELGAAQGQGRQLAPPPPKPDAPHPAGMTPAIARAGEDPTPENLDKAAEAIEAAERVAIERILASKPPKEPKRLTTFLRGIGGLKDDGGVVKQMTDVGRGRPDRLLNNKTGMDPDLARVTAWEAGYFYGAEPPELGEFLDAIADDISDVTPRYRQDDFEAVDQWNSWHELQRELDRDDVPFPDMAFSFGGRQAVGFKPEAFTLAGLLTDQGLDPHEIWRRTAAIGQPWYRDADGNWITESEDRGLAIIKDGGTGRVGEAIFHPSMFFDYPRLADMDIDLRPRDKEDRPHSLGWYRAPGLLGPRGKVRVMARSSAGKLTTTAHELQHAIDDIEGRPYGFGRPYHLRPGERRAMNVEFRRNMTMQQRIDQPPWVTEDAAVSWALGAHDPDAAPGAKFEGAAPALQSKPKPTGPSKRPYGEGKARGQPSRRDVEPREVRGRGTNFGDRDYLGRRSDRGTSNDQYEYSEIAIPVRGRTFLSTREFELKAKTDPALKGLPVEDNYLIDFEKPVRDQAPAVKRKLLKLVEKHGIKGVFGDSALDELEPMVRAEDDEFGIHRSVQERDAIHAFEDAGMSGEEMDLLRNAKQEGKTLDAALAELDEFRREYFDGGIDQPQTDVATKFFNAMSIDPLDAMPSEIISALHHVQAQRSFQNRDREAAMQLLDGGLVGGRFKAGFGKDAETSLIVFDPDAGVAPMTWGGRMYSFGPLQEDVPRVIAPATPDELRAAAVEAFGEGAQSIFMIEPAPKGVPAGAIAFTRKATKQVTLIEGRVAADQVKGLLLHEVGAHYKLEEMMGRSQFAGLLGEVVERAAEGKGPWAQIWEETRLAPDHLRAEEMLGSFLERHPDLAMNQSWWPKLVAAVRRWAAKIFGPKLLADEDIVALARSAVMARIEDGPSPFNPRTREIALARGPQNAQPPAGFGQPKQGASQPQGPVTPEAARLRFLEAKTKTARRRLGLQFQNFRNGSGERDAGEFLQAVLDFQGQGSGLALSVDGLRKAVTARTLAEVEAALHHFRAGVAGRRVNKADLENFVKEMFGEDTKDPSAKALADAVQPALEKLRQRFNRAGGQIGKLDRWGLPQSHDTLALRNFIEKNGGKVAGRAALKDRLYQSLDVTRMRDVHTGKPMSAQEVWNALDSVIEDMLTDGWATRTPSGAPVTQGSLASRRADHRFLIFRDPATWIEWQRDFGAGDPMTAVVAHVETMARDIAAMEILGPNPDATIEWLKQKALAEAGQAAVGRPAALPKNVAARKNPAEYVAGKIKRMDDMWLNYTGAVNVPVNQTLARWSATTRNLLTGSALGSAIISAMPTDPVFQAFARQFAGTSHGRAMGLLVRQTFNPREAAQMAIIMDHALASFGDDAKFARELGAPGWSGVVASQVLAASGLTPWTRGGRQIFGMGFLADLGNRAGDAFADLEAPLQRTLTRYGIDPGTWDQIRAAPLNADGFMQPDLVERAAGADAADRLLHMILQETEYAVPSGTLRSRSFMRGRDQAGTLFGELRQSARMFLSFAATLPMLYGYRMAHQWNRGRGASGALYFGALASTLMVGGAIAIQMRAVRDGKDLQDMSPDNVAFWQAAFLQGGGLGIYGDFLFGNLNRMDRSLGETMGGAQLGFLSDLQEATIGEFSKGEKGDPLTETTQLLARNVPGSSLWYLKAGWDRVVEDGLKRVTDPEADAAFRRRIQNQKRSTGQGYFWRPGAALPDRLPVMSEAPPPN